MSKKDQNKITVVAECTVESFPMQRMGNAQSSLVCVEGSMSLFLLRGEGAAPTGRRLKSVRFESRKRSSLLFEIAEPL